MTLHIHYAGGACRQVCTSTLACGKNLNQRRRIRHRPSNTTVEPPTAAAARNPDAITLHEEVNTAGSEQDATSRVRQMPSAAVVFGGHQHRSAYFHC